MTNRTMNQGGAVAAVLAGLPEDRLDVLAGEERPDALGGRLRGQSGHVVAVARSGASSPDGTWRVNPSGQEARFIGKAIGRCCAQDRHERVLAGATVHPD